MGTSETRLSRRMLLQVASLTGLVGPAWTAEKSIGVVSEVVGQAFSEANDQRRKLSPKSPVFLGDTIATGVRSRLRAWLARKTSLRLGAQTRVTIDSFVAEAGGTLTLGSGALLLEVPAERSMGVAVQSPFALIAVRGTRFFAGQLAGAFSVFVMRGAVDVTASGTTVRLSRGEGTDIPRPGAAPGPVKKWGQPKIEKAMALVR
jgi:ferric-dicitrate binding protein FerR (iron transport regulator)